MKGLLDTARQWVLVAGHRVSCFALFLARLTVGVVFIQSGWGKLHNLPKVIDFFTSLGLPAPALQARLVSTTELVCGGLVLIGLFARLAAVPLMATMVVAIRTAKWDELNAFGDLFGFTEYTYLVLLFIIATMGAGLLSLDSLAVRALGLGKEPSPPRGPLFRWTATAVGVGASIVLGFVTVWALKRGAR